jgi:hypothetical protein
METVSGIVGDRNAVQVEVGALFREDAGSVIAANGSDTGQLHRRVSSAEDAAAANRSCRWTSTAVPLDESRTIDLQMASLLDDDPVQIVSLDGGETVTESPAEDHVAQEAYHDSDVCIVLN